MNALITIGVVVALMLVAGGVQACSRYLGRFPLDARSPGPIIQAARSSQFVVRPAELEVMERTVAESLASEAVARSKLDPILDALHAEAPHPPPAGFSRSRAAAGDRTRSLHAELSALEARWRIDD